MEKSRAENARRDVKIAELKAEAVKLNEENKRQTFLQSEIISKGMISGNEQNSVILASGKCKKAGHQDIYIPWRPKYAVYKRFLFLSWTKSITWYRDTSEYTDSETTQGVSVFIRIRVYIYEVIGQK